MKKYSGVVTRISDMKSLGPQGKLKSIGILLEGSDQWHNITEFSEQALRNILGDTEVGMEVTLEEQEVKGYMNIKKITKGLSQVDGSIGNYAEGEMDQTEAEKVMGNVYAMAEEKLNAIIEQNALTQTKVDKLMDLVMKLAKKENIDMGFTKAEDL